MEFVYETHGSHTYLVYKFEETDVIDTLSRGMLTYNEIPGLAKTMYSQMDSVRFLRYDVSAKIPVSQFFSGQINRKRLIGIFSGIVDAMLSAEDYMIDPRSIIMDLDYMYTDVSTCETVMICLPIITDKVTTVDYSAFFKDIMYRSQFDQTENLDHIAIIINYINRTPVFSFDEFRKILDSISTTVTDNNPATGYLSDNNGNSLGQQPSVVSDNKEETSRDEVNAWKDEMKGSHTLTGDGISADGALTDHGTDAQSDDKKEKEINSGDGKESRSNKLWFWGKQIKKLKDNGDTPTGIDDMFIPGDDTMGSETSTEKTMLIPDETPNQTHVILGNFGDTTVLSTKTNGGETTVLSGGNYKPNEAPKPYLIRVKNQERILIDKPVFRIGKEKSFVDYFIGDNSAISRSHANLIVREGSYYVMDTNSTNHTYVNGSMIQSLIEIKISSGTKLRFANEEFEFKLI